MWAEKKRKRHFQIFLPLFFCQPYVKAPGRKMWAEKKRKRHFQIFLPLFFCQLFFSVFLLLAKALRDAVEDRQILFLLFARRESLHYKIVFLVKEQYLINGDRLVGIVLPLSFGDNFAARQPRDSHSRMFHDDGGSDFLCLHQPSLGEIF